MFNFTVTITGSSELLAVLSNLSSAIAGAKLVPVPQTNSKLIPVDTIQGQANPQTIPGRQANQSNSYPIQDNMVNQNNSTEQPQTLQTVALQAQQQLQAGYVEQQQQVSMQTQMPPASTVPVSVQAYSMEQLAVAATQLVDSGRRVELVNLLKAFGVDVLAALPKENYGQFAIRLRMMGAKI